MGCTVPLKTSTDWFVVAFMGNQGELILQPFTKLYWSCGRRFNGTVQTMYGIQTWSFFCKSLQWTLAAERVVGGSSDKSRWTCLACCNKSDIEKRPLMFVGKSQKRAFKKNQANKSGSTIKSANDPGWCTIYFLIVLINLMVLLDRGRDDRFCIYWKIVQPVAEQHSFSTSSRDGEIPSSVDNEPYSVLLCGDNCLYQTILQTFSPFEYIE